MLQNLAELGVTFIPPKLRENYLRAPGTTIAVAAGEMTEFSRQLKKLHRFEELPGGNWNVGGVMEINGLPAGITGTMVSRGEKVAGMISWPTYEDGKRGLEIVNYVWARSGLGRNVRPDILEKAKAEGMESARILGLTAEAELEWWEWTKPFYSLWDLVRQGREIVVFNNARGKKLDYMSLCQAKPMEDQRVEGFLATIAWKNCQREVLPELPQLRGKN